jgi:hypothetical protein
MSHHPTASSRRTRSATAVLGVVLGLLLLAASLVPSALAAGPTPHLRVTIGPTPTPIPGLVKHG